jgi:nucleotide-binding universal stress UspA family protein
VQLHLDIDRPSSKVGGQMFDGDEAPMQTIVVGYDDTPPARAALSWAAIEAGQRRARLLVVYVVSSAGEWELAAAQVNPDPIRREFERLLDGEWTATLRDGGVEYDTRIAVGKVGQALRQVASDADAAMIVVGMTHHGVLADLVAGDTEHDLLRHSARPVVAVPAEWQD